MTERVRVLYITYAGTLKNGGSVQYRYLIEGLNRSARYKPLVLTPANDELSDTLARAGIQTWVCPYPVWARSEIVRWRHKLWLERQRARDRLIAFARAHAPHLVHGEVAVAPYLADISAALGIPSVVHVGGSVKPRLARRLRLRHANALIAIGNPYRDELLNHRIPAERVAVISDATDLAKFHPQGCAVLRQEDPSIAPGDVLFGIVGRIEPFKRQLEFLRAAERIIASGRRVRFFVIGAPNRYMPWYVRRVRAFLKAHRMDRWVTLTGARSDMEHVMASLDVLVTLSGGSVMLEGMACGVPVITASPRSPQSLRIVHDGEAGRVVPLGDREALVRVMTELCDDSEQRTA